MVTLIIESAILLIGLISGVYAWHYLNLFNRICFFQLVSYSINEILANVVKAILKANNLFPDNHWVYNLTMPIETGLLAWAAFEYFKQKKYSFLIWAGYAIFILVYCSDIYYKSWRIFANQGYVAESVLLVILFLIILYRVFSQQNMKWKSSPEVWICFGIVLYFGGVVPYFSLIHYLQENDPKTNKILYFLIIKILANIRYLLLALGFWLVRRNALAKTSSANG